MIFNSKVFLTAFGIFSLLAIQNAHSKLPQPGEQASKPIPYPQPVGNKASEIDDCLIDKDGCMIPLATQSCSSPLTVTTAAATGNAANNCKMTACGLDSAIARANQCAASQPVGIRFDPAVFPAASIDLSAAGFSTPYLIGGAHPIEIDGGASRVLIKGGNSSQFAFQAKGVGVRFKNLLLQDFTKSALVIGATATDTDIRNVGITSSSSSDDGIRTDAPVAANSPSNAPVFIRPGPHAGEFVAYAILPKDSEIHFYAKSGEEMEWGGLESNLIPNPETGKLEFSPLLDSSKTPIDADSVEVVAGFLSGFAGSDKLAALVKTQGKNISLVRTGLPATFFSDSDGDYLSDDAETAWFGTDKSNADSDGNKIGDYSQVIDPETNVPRAKKNADGSYAFAAGDFSAQVQGQDNAPPPSGDKSGGCMFAPSAQGSLPTSGWAWLAFLPALAGMSWKARKSR